MVDTSDKWLKKLGVTASGKKAMQALVDKAVAELEWRIGNILIKRLSNKQIDEFYAIEDEDKRIDWLGKAYPNYQEVVKVEYDKMSQQIKKSSDKVKLIKSWKQA